MRGLPVRAAVGYAGCSVVLGAVVGNGCAAAGQDCRAARAHAGGEEDHRQRHRAVAPRCGLGEVPLGEDIKDWNSKALTESERNLLTQIFRFFTQSDIEVSDNYFKRYIPIFQPLEIGFIPVFRHKMALIGFHCFDGGPRNDERIGVLATLEEFSLLNILLKVGYAVDFRYECTLLRGRR